MNTLPSNIRKDLARLIPSSFINEISCFTFYDKHPQDTKCIDVIICTQRGEIQEIYNRTIVSSFLIDKVSNPTEIKIFRNKNCDLFYLVTADDEISILSRKEQITLLRKINNIAKYDIDDVECTGKLCLKIILKDDALPLIFDENFETHLTLTDTNKNEVIPLMLDLNRKLTEAKYCVQFNENKYEEYLKLYQSAAFNIYQKTSTSENTLIGTNINKLSNLLKIGTKTPEIKFYNEKVLIIFNISNQNSLYIENVCLIVHTASKHSLIYTTKCYEAIPQAPYWKEIKSQKIKHKSEVFIIAVIDWKELQYCAQSDIELDILLSYAKENKPNLLPLDKIKITPSDVMSEKFDILSSTCYDSCESILCILATSEATKLHFRQLSDSTCLSPSEIFGNHLNMALLPNFPDIFIHKLSPHHILYGVLVIFTVALNNVIEVNIFSRSPSQILALIGYIHDVVPQRLVITPANYKIDSIVKDMSVSEEVSDISIGSLNNTKYKRLSVSVIKQTSIIKEYLDDCMIKMNESKNTLIQNKVGAEIDLIALGLPMYLQFKSKMHKEIQRGIDNETDMVQEDLEYMIIDE